MDAAEVSATDAVRQEGRHDFIDDATEGPRAPHGAPPCYVCLRCVPLQQAGPPRRRGMYRSFPARAGARSSPGGGGHARTGARRGFPLSLGPVGDGVAPVHGSRREV